MTPVDPAELAPAPERMYFDADAYRLRAVNTRTGAPVDGSFTPILRFSVHGPLILALDARPGHRSPSP